MRLLVGAVAYLVAAAAVVVAAFAGLSTIERRQVAESLISDRPADDPAARRARALEEAKIDPNRVPVWIVATPKYVYTPVPVDPRPKHTRIIGNDAKAAMAKAGHWNRQDDGRRAIESALGVRRESAGRSLGFAPTRRDNDPFFRD